MCGIAGVARLGGAPLGPTDRVALRRMAAAIAHRGPDDEQYVVEGPVGLAFRRLAIVDVAGGRQPLRNETGTIALIANGEIYNHESIRARLSHRHEFRTRSDCEALLHLYEEEGSDCFRALVGMYAAAIWDAPRRKLLLARDPLGIKPLFYAAGRERLLFASEIKALLQHPDCPRAFDWVAALQDPLVSGVASTDASDPSSFFQGIEQLPAGCVVEVDVERGTIERRRYWELGGGHGGAAGAPPMNEDDAVRAYGELLRDAVRKCLMSDVELGIFLSGGIDSAAVAALASAAGATCHTFTVLSQSTLANGDARAGHAVAKWLGLPNHQVVFRWDRLSVTPDDWKALLWLCETPLCGAEQLYKFHLHRYAKAVRPDLKVILTGQGSDEFNGGYSSMIAPPDQRTWEGFLTALALMERGRLLRAWPQGLLAWEGHVARSPISQRFLASRDGGWAGQMPWRAYLATKYRDLQMYNCWHEDRTAAGNSIENRVPFLDHRLVEFALSVPEALHSTLFWDKRILREALVDVLPADIRARPKGPFFYGPDERFTHRMMLRVLTHNDGALVEEAFSSGTAADVVDRDAVADILRGMADDPAPAGVEVLLRLVNMGLLDGLARQYPGPAPQSAAGTLSAIAVADWETDHEAIRVSLGVRREGIGLDAVPALPANVYVVRREDTGEEGTWYIVVDGRVEYSLSESTAGPWLRVLQQIDGRRTLGELLRAASVSQGEIRTLLEEAIDFGVVMVSDAAVVS